MQYRTFWRWSCVDVLIKADNAKPSTTPPVCFSKHGHVERSSAAHFLLILLAPRTAVLVYQLMIRVSSLHKEACLSPTSLAMIFTLLHSQICTQNFIRSALPIR